MNQPVDLAPITLSNKQTSCPHAQHSKQGQAGEIETSLPPGSKSPRIWQLLKYQIRQNEFFDECYRRYGDIFTLRLAGLGTWVFVDSPKLARELYTSPLDNRANRRVEPFGLWFCRRTSGFIYNGWF